MVEYRNIEYAILSMVTLEEFVGCTITHDLYKMSIKISKLHLIAKMTQGFNSDIKLLMDFNTPATPHKGNFVSSRNRYKHFKIFTEEIK